MKTVVYTFICDGCGKGRESSSESIPRIWDWAKIKIQYEMRQPEPYLVCTACKDALVNYKSSKATWLELVSGLLKKGASR